MICPLRNPMPENYLELFAKHSAGKLDDVKDEPVLGWVSGRHLLESRIDETTSMCGGFPYMNLRKTERKVASQLLNAVCRRDELAYMQANDCLFVPRKEKRAIKEEAIQALMPKMVPTISAVPFVVDTASNVLYFGASSLAKFDVFVQEFTRALGLDVEPVPLSVDELMASLLKKNETDLPPLTLTNQANGMDEPQPGRDFLTWLWYEAEVNGGRCSVGELGDFVVALEGPITLAYSPGKSKDPDLAGSGESVVKRGNPMASGEAKAALSSGKKLRKARVTFAREVRRFRAGIHPRARHGRRTRADLRRRAHGDSAEEKRDRPAAAHAHEPGERHGRTPARTRFPYLALVRIRGQRRQMLRRRIR